MNSITNFWPSPKFKFLAIQQKYHPEGDKYFIHKFEFVNIFPMKMYQNYFREEIDANQWNVQVWH